MQFFYWLLYFGLLPKASVGEDRDQKVKNDNKLVLNKLLAKDHTWVASNCKHLVGLLRQKNVVIKKLAIAANAVGKDETLSEPERHFQV